MPAAKPERVTLTFTVSRFDAERITRAVADVLAQPVPDANGRTYTVARDAKPDPIAHRGADPRAIFAERDGIPYPIPNRKP